MNNKITFVEIAEQIAESTSTSKRVCELFLRELVATITQALIDGEDVKIKGVGTFKVTRTKTRKSVSISTGDAIEIDGHNKLSFTPDKSLAEAVNQPFAQFETVFLDDAMTDEKLAEIDKEYPSLFDEGGLDVTAQPENVEASDGTESTGTTETTGATDGTESTDITGSTDVTESTGATETTGATDETESTDVTGPTELESKDDTVVPTVVSEPSEPVRDEPVSRPMLVGIPIDGPTQPKPEPEPVEETNEDEYFYRPAPRNAYTPTPEQLAAHSRKLDKRWIGLVVGILIGCLLMWLVMRGCEKTGSEPQTVVPADTVAQVEEEPVVTETITDQNVLSTMAARHYGSQWFWVYIYEENKDKIKNPDNVPLGTVVVIPPADKYGIDAKDPKSLKKAQLRSWEILKGR